MITTQEKQAKAYVIPPNSFKADVIDVDTSKRTVSAIGNTYNFIDFDMDMLLMGSSARSIADRGPNSNAKAKMKHLKDHIQRTDFIAGKFLNVEETTFEGREVLKFESEISDPKILELYQNGTLDQHSIGFRYVDIKLADRSGDNEQRQLFDRFLSNAINPEVGEQAGFFFVVKEIELFEISTVVFGANSETGVTGIKNKEPKTQELILMTYLDATKRILHNNKSKFTPDDYRMAELNIKQFEQAIMDIQNPPVKEALKPSVNGISQNHKARELLNLLNF